MENAEIARMFERTADALEITGENRFKVRAYRQAALSVRNLSEMLEHVVEDDPKKLKSIAGIGEGMQEHIIEIVKTGKFKKLDKLLKKVSPKLLDLMDVSGIGPKHLKALHDELGVNNAGDLEEACKKHRVRELEGFGEKTENKILDALGEYKRSEGRMKLDEATAHANSIMEYLNKDKKNIKRLELAGSLRRGQETVGDIDILVAAKDADKIMKKFTDYPEAKKTIAKGKTKTSILLNSGIQVDLRNIDEERFGSALIYFIGSKAHNIHIRKIAKSKNLKISEYGVFKGKKNKASRRQKDVYKAIGLKYIEPEMREDRGEVEAASKGKLPSLVELKDIKGDLHMHTKATDGANTIEEMARAAMKRGYKYIAITEHTKAVRVAGGLNDKEISKHLKKIARVNKKLKKIKILKGAEVDIKEDGSLDLADKTLKELDIVIGAVHSKFNMSEKEMTQRLLRAMDNKYLNIIAHPTGRLIGKRKPYKFDYEKVFKKARKNNIALEVNAHEDRLDLKDVHCKLAKEIGAKIIISTDSHATAQLNNMNYGVITARRGWLEKKDVLNTLNYKEFMKKIKRK